MIALHIIALVSMMLIITGLSVLVILIMPRFCYHTTTIKLSSIQKIKCADCYKLIDWPLKDGQQPLVSSSRDRRKK